MADYLKNFETTEEYEEYIDGDFLKPNVSYLIDNNQVRYNPVPPPRDEVGFSNILSTEIMVAVKDGKVIVSGSGDAAMCYIATQNEVDEIIANNASFGYVLELGLLQQSSINRIKFDDQEPITPDKRIDVSAIAYNSEILIYVEPQFVPVNE